MKSEPKAFASLSSGLLARKGAARPAMRPQGFGQGGSGLEDLGWNDMGYDSPKPSLVPVADGEVPHLSRSPLIGLTPASPVHDQQAEIEQRFTSYDSDEGESDEASEDEADETAVTPFASLAGSFEPEVEAGDEDEAESEDELEMLELSAELADEDEALPEAMPAPAVVDAHAPLVPFAATFARVAVEHEAAPEPEYEPAYEPELEPALQQAAEPACVPDFVPLAAVAAAKPRRQAIAEPATAGKGKAAFTLRLDPSRHLKLRLACAVTGRSAQQLVTRALDELLAAMPELDAMAERAPAERASRKG